jgi:hypothetical protein
MVLADWCGDDYALVPNHYDNVLISMLHVQPFANVEPLNRTCRTCQGTIVGGYFVLLLPQTIKATQHDCIKQQPTMIPPLELTRPTTPDWLAARKAFWTGFDGPLHCNILTARALVVVTRKGDFLP